MSYPLTGYHEDTYSSDDLRKNEIACKKHAYPPAFEELLLNRIDIRYYLSHLQYLTRKQTDKKTISDHSHSRINPSSKMFPIVIYPLYKQE